MSKDLTEKCQLTKEQVAEVLEFHVSKSNDTRFAPSITENIKEALNTLGQSFGYNDFMTKVDKFVTFSGKLVPQGQNYLASFKIRMRKLKKGQDWRVL